MSVPTAARLGLVACHVCELVARAPTGDAGAHCPRCGAHLHSRKPERRGAHLGAADRGGDALRAGEHRAGDDHASIFGTQRDTILSGVAYL